MLVKGRQKKKWLPFFGCFPVASFFEGCWLVSLRFHEATESVEERVTSLLRGYDHASLKPHHKIFPPEFDGKFLMDYNAAYHYLRKRHVATLSHEDFLKILKKNGRFEAVVEVGRLGELTDLGLPCRIVKLRALQGHEQNSVEASDPEFLIGSVMTLDPNYAIESCACGKHPREPNCGRGKIYPWILGKTPVGSLGLVYFPTNLPSLYQKHQPSIKVLGGWAMRTCKSG